MLVPEMAQMIGSERIDHDYDHVGSAYFFPMTAPHDGYHSTANEQ